MGLIDYIDSRAIMLDVQETDKQRLLKKIIERLYECDLILDKEEAENAIIAREELMSTGVGNGIAIPHAKTDAVDSIRLTIATVKSGINYKSVDRKKVFIIFLLLSPKDAASENLKVLTSIAKILRANHNFIERLINADEVDEIIKLISKEESKF